MRRPGSGNHFVRCAQGHTHWGRFGAAGLLLGDGDDVLVQHRAAWTHEGDTWSVPGGAADAGEDAVGTALREAQEETILDVGGVRPVGWAVADHGGWHYTTVAAVLAPGHTRPVAAARDRESTELRWVRRADVGGLALHPGFAAAWAGLCRVPPPVTVVVDVANVMGSRPDGWWRDRAGAATRWWAELTASVARGWPAAGVPAGIDAGGLDVLTPRLRLVLEGAARTATAPATGPAWADALVRGVPAAGSGDDTVVAEVSTLARTGDQVLVVTSDRELRARVAGVAPHAVVVGPRALPTTR